MRSTRQRALILDAVQSTMTHPTAGWIYQQVRRRLPRISLGTVYRNLQVLQRAGCIAEIRHGRMPSRYEAVLDRHYHIRCLRCGRLDDLPISPRRSLERAAERVSHYEVWDHSVDVIGVCPRCRDVRGKGSRELPTFLQNTKEKSNGESRSSSRRAGRHQRR